MTDAIQREEQEARAAARRDYQRGQGHAVQLQIPDLDRKLDLFIDREIDQEIETEIGEQRSAIMAELEEYRRECHTEIEGHYKKTGRAPYSYRQGHHPGAYGYGGHQGYYGHPD